MLDKPTFLLQWSRTGKQLEKRFNSIGEATDHCRLNNIKQFEIFSRVLLGDRS
jgi:hypothetical protein